VLLIAAKAIVGALMIAAMAIAIVAVVFLLDGGGI
jgi:hypothetical protein